MQYLRCLLGIAFFIALAWAISWERRRFQWRVVLGGIALQVAIVLLVAKTDAGRSRSGSGECGLRPHCPHSLESLVSFVLLVGN